MKTEERPGNKPHLPETRCSIREQQKPSLYSLNPLRCELSNFTQSYKATGLLTSAHIHTWLFVPVSVGRNKHTPPPEAHSPVKTEQRVAVGFLIEFSVHELLVQGAQLGYVGLSAHRGAAVLVPVLRSDGHRQIHGGYDAQHAGDD